MIDKLITKFFGRTWKFKGVLVDYVIDEIIRQAEACGADSASIAKVVDWLRLQMLQAHRSILADEVSVGDGRDVVCVRLGFGRYGVRVLTEQCDEDDIKDIVKVVNEECDLEDTYLVYDVRFNYNVGCSYIRFEDMFCVDYDLRMDVKRYGFNSTNYLSC